MNIELNGDGTVTLNMSEYVSEAINNFQEEIKHEEATTPAKKTLFKIDENSPKLNTNSMHYNFHSIIAKLLYILAKSARPDILLPVAFLCTRATKSTKEDWTKLKRVLEYLKRYKDLTLTLGADSINNLDGYVDAAYGVHQDSKGHPGSLITFGRGALMAQSKKQQLMTKSSTECEIIGASDYAPGIVWAGYFMEAQGHPIINANIHQGNQSAMQMEENGRTSAGSKSKLINNRYFWVTNRVKSS